MLRYRCLKWDHLSQNMQDDVKEFLYIIAGPRLLHTARWRASRLRLNTRANSSLMRWKASFDLIYNLLNST